MAILSTGTGICLLSSRNLWPDADICLNLTICSAVPDLRWPARAMEDAGSGPEILDYIGSLEFQRTIVVSAGQPLRIWT